MVLAVANWIKMVKHTVHIPIRMMQEKHNTEPPPKIPYS